MPPGPRRPPGPNMPKTPRDFEKKKNQTKEEAEDVGEQQNGLLIIGSS